MNQVQDQKYVEKIYSWVKKSKLQILLIFFALAFSITTSYTAGFSMIMKVPVLPILLWLFSITCMIWVGCKSFKPNKGIVLSCIFWFCLFTVLALPWRVIDTAHIPVSLSGDEGSAGVYALNFLTGRVNNLFSMGWNSFPAMFSLFQAGSIALFGQTIPGLRILSGLIGSVSVGAVYLLGRALFDHKIGLYAAICMIGFHYQIHFSRIALNNICDGLSFCLVVATFWLSWKRKNRFFFTISGLLAGFSVYFYETSKILILLIFLWMFFLAASDWQRFKSCVPNFIIFAFSFFIVAFPLIRFYLGHYNEFVAHMHRLIFADNKLQGMMAASGISTLWLLIKQTAIGFGGFIWVPLKFFYEPGTALLTPLEAVVFCLGVFFSILFIKDPRAKLCLIWIILFGLLISFTDYAPAAQRYIGVAPLCMVVVGLGLRSLEVWLTRKRIFKRKKSKSVILFFAISLCWIDIIFYFGVYYFTSNYGTDYAIIDTTLAENLNKIKGEKNVYYYGTPKLDDDKFQILLFLAPDAKEYDIDENLLNTALPGSSETPKVFVILDPKMDLTDLQNKYPGGTLLTGTDSIGRFLFWQYTIGDRSG
jgi:Dolichyl-phosphate-mannose-protein mannosyltransferase